MIYTVKCQAASENSLVGVNLYNPNNITEFLGYDDDDNEIYEIETEYDIDRILDQTDGIIEYRSEP